MNTEILLKRVSYDSKLKWIFADNLWEASPSLWRPATLWVQFRYKKLANFYYSCGMIGHPHKLCKRAANLKSSVGIGPFMRADPVTLQRAVIVRYIPFSFHSLLSPYPLIWYFSSRSREVINIDFGISFDWLFRLLIWCPSVGRLSSSLFDYLSQSRFDVIGHLPQQLWPAWGYCWVAICWFLPSEVFYSPDQDLWGWCFVESLACYSLSVITPTGYLWASFSLEIFYDIFHFDARAADIVFSHVVCRVGLCYPFPS